MEYLTLLPHNTWIQSCSMSHGPISLEAILTISGAVLVLYNGLTPIDVGRYSYVEVVSGIYRIILNTTYAPSPEHINCVLDLTLACHTLLPPTSFVNSASGTGSRYSPQNPS